MRFGYSYKTSDAVWHEDEISAKDRESVFSQLKGRGIKPIKVWEKDSRRSYKRWIAIVVLSFAVIALIVVVLRQRGAGVDSAIAERPVRIESSIRHYIPEITAEQFAAFDRPSERYLACYAFPGESSSPPELTEKTLADFVDSMKKPVVGRANDSDAMRELRAIVAGMKEELVRYVRIGGGVRDYLTMLETRQGGEVDHRKRIVSEFLRKTKGVGPDVADEMKNAANESLRVMGMREM